MILVILKYEVIAIIIVQLTKKSPLAARHVKWERVLVAWARLPCDWEEWQIQLYILPVAKQLGRNLFEVAVPEIGQVLAGGKRPSGKMLKHVAETATKKTVDFGGEFFWPLGRGERCTAAGGTFRRRTGVRRPDGSSGWPEWTGSTNRKRRNFSAASLPESTTTRISSKSSPAKRSRSDILSEFQFA